MQDSKSIPFGYDSKLVAQSPTQKAAITKYDQWIQNSTQCTNMPLLKWQKEVSYIINTYSYAMSNNIDYIESKIRIAGYGTSSLVNELKLAKLKQEVIYVVRQKFFESCREVNLALRYFTAAKKKIQCLKKVYIKTATSNYNHVAQYNQINFKYELHQYKKSKQYFIEQQYIAKLLTSGYHNILVCVSKSHDIQQVNFNASFLFPINFSEGV